MRATDGSTRLRVRLTPKGGLNALIKQESEILHVRVAAAPIDGAANRALVELLSKTIGIARSNILIVRGDAYRDKMLQFDGISSSELNSRIEKVLHAGSGQTLSEERPSDGQK